MEDRNEAFIDEPDRPGITIDTRLTEGDEAPGSSKADPNSQENLIIQLITQGSSGPVITTYKAAKGPKDSGAETPVKDSTPESPEKESGSDTHWEVTRNANVFTINIKETGGGIGEPVEPEG